MSLEKDKTTSSDHATEDVSLEGVKHAFKRFTKNKEFMNSRSWIKLLREAKLIDDVFSSTQADLVFAKLKRGNFITEELFIVAVQEVASKRKEHLSSVVEKICNVGYPTYSGTTAQYIRFFDEKEAYTGTHRHGGPSTYDKKKSIIDDTQPCYDMRGPGSRVVLSDLLDRSYPTPRGLNKKYGK